MQEDPAFETQYAEAIEKIYQATIDFERDGDYWFTVDTTDLAGNAAERFVQEEFTIDLIAPTITILIGGYFNNSIEALKDLRPPQDEHIVYNFHCYEPLIFTHQGAYWVNGMDTSFRMPYDSTYREYAEMAAREIDHYYSSFDGFAPDEPFGPAFFEQLIAEAVSVAEERDVALYCGEFGVIDLADAEDTAKWYRAICGVLDRYHIGRAAWTYKEMDFGFIDGHLGSSLEEVLFALRGQK